MASKSTPPPSNLCTTEQSTQPLVEHVKWLGRHSLFLVHSGVRANFYLTAAIKLTASLKRVRCNMSQSLPCILISSSYRHNTVWFGCWEWHMYVVSHCNAVGQVYVLAVRTYSNHNLLLSQVKVLLYSVKSLKSFSIESCQLEQLIGQNNHQTEIVFSSLFSLTSCYCFSASWGQSSNTLRGCRETWAFIWRCIYGQNNPIVQ